MAPKILCFESDDRVEKEIIKNISFKHHYNQ